VKRKGVVSEVRDELLHLKNSVETHRPKEEYQAIRERIARTREPHREDGVAAGTVPLREGSSISTSGVAIDADVCEGSTRRGRGTVDLELRQACNVRGRQTVQAGLDAVESGQIRGSASTPAGRLPRSGDLPPVLR